MEIIDRAANIALLQIKEAEATAHIRDSYQEIIVSNASYLMPILKQYGQKEKLDTALKYRNTDPSTLYRGLIIQLNGAFEGFIKALCASIVGIHSERTGSFSRLPEDFKTDHIVNAAQILGYMKSGTVKGIKYDFEKLKNSIAHCILDDKDYYVQADVFTILLGNCTSKRIENLFGLLFIPGPFDDVLYEYADIRRWAGMSLNKRRMAEHVKVTLDQNIDLRNDITHGNISKSLVSADFFNSSSFFKVIIPAIAWRASKGLRARYSS